MPEWLVPTLIVVGIVGLVGVIWRMHESHDRERISQLWDQIGRDSKHGMREILHKVANAFDALVKEVPELRRRIERLERRRHHRENHEEE